MRPNAIIFIMKAPSLPWHPIVSRQDIGAWSNVEKGQVPRKMTHFLHILAVVNHGTSASYLLASRWCEFIASICNCSFPMYWFFKLWDSPWRDGHWSMCWNWNVLTRFGPCFRAVVSLVFGVLCPLLNSFWH